MAQEVGPLLGGNPDGPRPGVGSAGFTHVRSGVFFVYHHGRRIDPGREIDFLAMPSNRTKRTIRISGHWTSVNLEDEFWRVQGNRCFPAKSHSPI